MNWLKKLFKKKEQIKKDRVRFKDGNIVFAYYSGTPIELALKRQQLAVYEIQCNGDRLGGLGRQCAYTLEHIRQ